MYLKLGKLFIMLKIENNQEAQEKLLTNYSISPGSTTMEWVQPSPPAAHTYVELPIIKNAEESGHH